ncbi:MAG: hypothetical protein H0X38_02345, partial [Planctomycetes bacterium]|nr:hypothetical protein [Planctomycetota bacterium]
MHRRRGRGAVLALMAIGLLLAGREVLVAASDDNLVADPTFAFAGMVDGDGTAITTTSFVVDANDRLVTAGGVGFDSNARIGIGRFTRDGARDADFNSGRAVILAAAGANTSFVTVAVQADGRIVTAVSTAVGTAVTLRVTRLGVDGTPDPSFGSAGVVLTTSPDLNFTVKFIAVGADGRIFVAGSGGTHPHLIFAYSPDGNLDNGFNGNGVVAPTQGPTGTFAALQGNQLLIAGLDGLRSSGLHVVRYLGNGRVDTSFANAGDLSSGLGLFGNHSGSSLAVQNDGKILLTADNGSDFRVLRFLATGAPDAGFGTAGTAIAAVGAGGTSIANSVAVRSDGFIYVAGETAGAPRQTTAGTLTLERLTFCRFTTAGTLDTYNGDGVVPASFTSDNSHITFMITRSGFQSDGSLLLHVFDDDIGFFSNSIRRYLPRNGLRTTFSIPGGNFARVSPVPISLAFDAPVSGLTSQSFVITNGIATLNGFGTTFTLQVTPTDQGDVGISLPFGAAHDAGGDPLVAASASFVFDSISPQLAILPVNGSILNSLTIPMAFTSSEETLISAENFSTSSGTLNNFASSDFLHHTAVLTVPAPAPGSQSVVTIIASVGSNPIHDQAGNPIPATTVTFTIDPTLIGTTLVPDQGDTIAYASPITYTIPFTLTFAQPVTGLSPSAFTIANGTLASLSGSGAVYQLTIKPKGPGDISVTLAANSATEPASHLGNPTVTSLVHVVPIMIKADNISGSRNIFSVQRLVTLPGIAGGQATSVITTPPHFGNLFQVNDDLSQGIQITGSDTAVTNQHGLVLYALGDLGGIAGSVHAIDIFTYSSDPSSASPHSSVSVIIKINDPADGASTSGALQLILTDALTGRPITGATASTASDPFFLSESASNMTGIYQRFINTNTSATITVAKTGYQSQTITRTITVGSTIQVSVGLQLDASTPVPVLSSTTASPAAHGPFPISVVFSKPVPDFTASGIAISNGTVTAFALVADDADNHFTFLVTPTAPGPVTMSVLAGAVRDASNHANAASAPLTIVFDPIVPTAALSSTAHDPTGAASFPLTITFSETVTGFALGDLVISGGSASGTPPGSGSSFACTITATGSGPVSVDLPAGRVLDAAGNPNTAATQLLRTVDLGGPTVTINQASGQADPTSSGSIAFTAVFSQPVTGFAANGVGLGGTASGTLTASVSGTGTTYAVIVTGMTGAGTVTAAILADAATSSGHPSKASTSTDNEVSFVPATPPRTVTINQASDQPDPTSAASIRFAVLFSQAVTGFTAGDVALSGSAGGTLTATVSGAGATYVVTVTGMTTSGTVSAAIPAGAVQDGGTVSAAASSGDDTVIFIAPAGSSGTGGAGGGAGGAGGCGNGSG